MHVKVEVSFDGGDIVLPADDGWLARMRESVAEGGDILLRLDNCPIDGSTGMIAITLGPAGLDAESESAYLEFGSAPSDSLFGILLDGPKLAELIAALQLMQAHFPAPNGDPRTVEPT
jgi:hypothetical protein